MSQKIRRANVNIVVLIKQTPDTAELPKVTADEVRSGAVKATMVINPWDEFAAEEAILLTDRFDGDVTAVSMGPADAVDALKHALAMGVGNASLIDNSGVAGDMWTTAAALAAAVKAQGDVDLVITGKQSVDDNSSAVFPCWTGRAKICGCHRNNDCGRSACSQRTRGNRQTIRNCWSQRPCRSGKNHGNRKKRCRADVVLQQNTIDT